MSSKFQTSMEKKRETGRHDQGSHLKYGLIGPGMFEAMFIKSMSEL